MKNVLWLTAATSVLSALVVLFSLGKADAVTTRHFVIDSGSEFAEGELTGTQVHSGGAITPGLELRRIPLTDAPVAFSVARAASGAVFIGTGNEGKVFKLQGDSLSLFAETGQLLVSSLETRGDQVYAGTLPEGRIFSIGPDGTSREFARPADAEHIWALAYDPNARVLYAGTGPQGKVFAINGQGTAEVYYDSEADHIMSLALDSEGTLYAGTSGEGHLLRLRGPGQAEVVHDFPGNEITSIAIRDGRIAVAANEFQAPPSAARSKAKVSKAVRRASKSSRPRPGKGRLYVVDAEGRAEQLIDNAPGHFTDVEIAADGSIYAAMGKDGRVQRVLPNRETSTVVDVDERQVLAIRMEGDDPLIVTSDSAAVYRVVAGPPQDAVWTSKALDAGFRSRFGQLSWRGEGTVELQTRSGNTEEPDTTWSEWSAALTAPGPVRSPAARFVQIRARFRGDADAIVRAIHLYYLPQNQTPVVLSVAEGPVKGKRTPTTPPSSKHRISWKMRNTDEDRLRYRLRFREEGQTIWRDMFSEDVEHTSSNYDWETGAIPDGWYVVEVRASDELENPESLVLSGGGATEPFLVDNHAPVFEAVEIRGGNLRGRVRDGIGPITRLEVSIDGGPFRVIYPSDHLLDTATESFDHPLALEPGPHIVAIRATDAARNSVTAEVEAGQRRPRSAQ